LVSDEDTKRQTLTLYSVRLHPSQIAFLRSLPNASEWLRKLIDHARVRDSATSTGNRVILLTQQIRDLDQQVSVVRENPSYVQAKTELPRIQREKSPVDAGVDFYQKLMRGTYDHLKDRMIRLPESVYAHLDYLEPPDKELWQLWESVRNLHHVMRQHPSIKALLSPFTASDIPSHIIEQARSDASTILPEILKVQENLAREEAKQKTIVAGFEQEIQALEEKRQGLEQELLRQSARSERSATLG
jgi:hypothetical protein